MLVINRSTMKQNKAINYRAVSTLCYFVVDILITSTTPPTNIHIYIYIYIHMCIHMFFYSISLMSTVDYTLDAVIIL